MNPTARFAIELAAMLAIAAGLWQINPPMSAVAIGALVLASSVLGRIRGN